MKRNKKNKKLSVEECLELWEAIKTLFPKEFNGKPVKYTIWDLNPDLEALKKMSRILKYRFPSVDVWPVNPICKTGMIDGYDLWHQLDVAITKSADGYDLHFSEYDRITRVFLPKEDVLLEKLSKRQDLHRFLFGK